MRKEAAYSATSAGCIRRGFLAAPAMNDHTTLETIARQHDTREVIMFSGNDASRGMRRFGLGLVFAALALFMTPALLDQQSVEAAPAPRLEQRAEAAQAAPEAVAPAAATEDGATQAPAAFSDALAAAPAGAQCSMEAHSCSVPSADGAQGLHSGETAVAFGFSQTLRGANHHERL